MNKFLVVGLGNIGSRYEETRHNIGFRMADEFAAGGNVSFAPVKFGMIADVSIKNASITLLKPDTLMNLSGLAVRYWLETKKIDLSHLLVLVDDLHLPFGQIRLRAKGSAGGHNGLLHIEQMLQSSAYARLRFGIGDQFPIGHQIDYVLGKWTDNEITQLKDLLLRTNDIIRSFCLQGVERTMNLYN